MMKLVLEHEKKKKLYSVANEAAKVFQELGIDRTEHKDTISVIKKAKKAKDQVKKRGKEKIRVREAASWPVPEKSEETRRRLNRNTPAVEKLRFKVRNGRPNYSSTRPIFNDKTISK